MNTYEYSQNTKAFLQSLAIIIKIVILTYLGRLFLESSESHNQVSRFSSINHTFNMFKRHLFMDFDSIFFRFTKVRLNKDEEILIYKNISDMHFLLNSYIAKNELIVG
jgi:hypothetical protein